VAKADSQLRWDVESRSATDVAADAVANELRECWLHIRDRWRRR